MATYRRNFEVVPKQGSKVTRINLGTAIPTFSGSLDFSSTPYLQSFRIRNATITSFDKVSACSALNVFDIADNFITLQNSICALSGFVDKKAFYPSVTGFIYLTGSGMPQYVEKPKAETPEFTFNVLVNYLTLPPRKWYVSLNYAPVFRYIENNWDTVNVVTTGNKSAYIVIPNNTNKNFILNINGVESLSGSVYYSFSQPTAQNYITLSASPGVQISFNELFYSNTVDITANGQINTLQYISHLNGPIMGIALSGKTLPFIETPPFETTLPEPAYPLPYAI